VRVRAGEIPAGATQAGDNNNLVLEAA
jgi:hypothetical protein